MPELSASTKPKNERPRHYRVIAAVPDDIADLDTKRTFISCPFQKPCWNNIRKPLIKANKGLYLPYICSFQTEGDIDKCSHYQRFKEDESV